MLTTQHLIVQCTFNCIIVCLQHKIVVYMFAFRLAAFPLFVRVQAADTDIPDNKEVEDTPNNEEAAADTTAPEEKLDAEKPNKDTAPINVIFSSPL